MKPEQLNDSLLSYFHQIGFSPEPATARDRPPLTSYTPNQKATKSAHKDTFTASSSQYQSSPEMKTINHYIRKEAVLPDFNQYLMPSRNTRQYAAYTEPNLAEETENLPAQLQLCAENLESHGFMRPGDLLVGGEEHARKTLTLLREMLRQHKKDQDFRERLNDKLQRIASERQSFKEKVELLKRDLLALENVNGGLKNKIETMKKQAKTLQEKLKFSGDESRTSCSKMEQKVKTLQFELKKKDATHERMKEQLKRHLEAKSYGYERNHIEITSRLHAAQECALPEGALAEELKEGHEARFAKLSAQNRNLKECLVQLQSGISHICKRVVAQIDAYSSQSKIAAGLVAEYRISGSKLAKLAPESLKAAHYETYGAGKALCHHFEASLEKLEAFMAEFMNPLQILHFTQRLMARFPEVSSRVKDFKNLDSFCAALGEHLSATVSAVGVGVAATAPPPLAAAAPPQRKIWKKP